MKSNVSDYLEIMQAVYIDACMKCSADVSDFRDIQTVISRTKNEGLSFLTITLPQYCQDFERSLSNGFIDSSAFRSFRKTGSIPVFLQGMISLIFSRETGRMIEYEISSSTCRGSESDIPTLVDSVRQICLTFKKVEVECTPDRVHSALSLFQSIEHELEAFVAPAEGMREFRRISSLLWDNLLFSISLKECIPRHGPGATADRLSGNQKYRWQRWHDRLEPYFPLVDNGYPLGIPFDSEELHSVTIVHEADEQPVRVITVPKTLKSPRIIAIEPCCMQYTQQGIRDVLYRRIATHDLTAGHLNFLDQSVNQSIALQASSTGQYATIDLSEASDRVPWSIAMEMFSSNPDLRDAINACRTTRAQLPNGVIIDPLRKFASMGSALCFPVEAMYFYTLCVMAVLRQRSLPETHSGVFEATRGIYVYGDDIIVPTTNAESVLDNLQKYNCKINANKTFRSGSFRESCGVEAYAGCVVTPTYLRKPPPQYGRQADRLVSWVATGNLFYLRGYWRTAQLIFNKVERHIGPLPYVTLTSPVLGRISYLGYESIERWNHKLQRFEVKGWTPVPVYHTDKLEGYGALVKCFLRDVKVSDEDTFTMADVLNGHLPTSERSELEHSALHGAVALKRRWAPPH